MHKLCITIFPYSLENFEAVKKTIRIKDIAEEAGVSTGTVDRVIHGRGNVSQKKKERILNVMKKLGYERNIVASTLAYNKTIRIAVLLPDPATDPYWNEPLNGIQDGIQAVQHFGVKMTPYLFDIFSEADFSNQANQALMDHPDALLIAPLFLKESKLVLEKAEQLNIPNVMINTNLHNESTLSYIGPDSYQSGLLAGRLLHFGLQKGEAALLLNLSKGSTNAHHLLEKEEGFRDYFRTKPNSQIKIIKYDFEHFSNTQKLALFLDNLLHLQPDIRGIFITNSRSYHVVEALPTTTAEQLIIVGFDLIEQNIQFLGQNKINFLINQNSFQQGYLGVMTLFDHFILRKKILLNQFLPLDIIVKENHMYHQHNTRNTPFLHT